MAWSHSNMAPARCYVHSRQAVCAVVCSPPTSSRSELACTSSEHTKQPETDCGVPKRRPDSSYTSTYAPTKCTELSQRCMHIYLLHVVAALQPGMLGPMSMHPRQGS